MTKTWCEAELFAIARKDTNVRHFKRLLRNENLSQRKRRIFERAYEECLMRAYRAAWNRAALHEYIPYMSRYNPETGTFRKYDLKDEPGKTINIPLITRIKGRPSAVLDGTEELANYNCDIAVDWTRR